jgi:phosphohistidine phosphatase
MDLYIVRHAWAAERDHEQWPDDDRRPLTEKGKDRFARMIAKLVDRGMKPQIIATSPLVRCRETAESLAAASGKIRVVPLEPLRPGGNADALLRWTAQEAEEYHSMVWVGHAPEVGRLVALMIGDACCRIRMPKGAVAAIRFENPPQPGGGELRWLATAKLLGC